MTRQINSRRGRGRLREIILDGLRQWHGGISTELVQNTRHGDLLMIIPYGRAPDDDDNCGVGNVSF